MKKQNVWFITGASRGLGYEIAKAVLHAGDRVVATVRKDPDKLYAAFKDHKHLLVIEMDVTNESEVTEVVQQAVNQFGKLDIIVNNAGYGIVGAIEEVTDAEARKQYDTNVFGLLNVLRATIPYLRANRSGHVINVSSLFAFDPPAGWSLYASTKNAVEGISQGLAKELEPFGIKVTVVEPGLFRTDFTSRTSYAIAKSPINDYQGTMVEYMRKGTDSYHGSQPGNPSKLAALVVKMATSENPPLYLPIGKDAINYYNIFRKRIARDVKAWKKDAESTDFE